jgi:hypothetical protein
MGTARAGVKAARPSQLLHGEFVRLIVLGAVPSGT